jgi:hypothetical protein
VVLRAGGGDDPSAPDGGEKPILSYSTVLGSCTSSACANASANNDYGKDWSGEPPGPGILSVTVDTQKAQEDVPPASWSWFLYDGANNSSSIALTTARSAARDESMFRFDMGYPARSRFQAYVCLPPATGGEDDGGGNTTNTTARLTTFAMGRIPDGVAVALEKNEEPLTCREPVSANLQSYPLYVWGSSYLSILDADDLVTTPLDGTCSSGTAPLSAGAIAGIVVGALAGAVLLVLAAVHLRRRRARTARHGAGDDKEAQTSPEGPAEA